MATTPATTIWRIRAGGNALNAGGFDPSTSGAGRDYTDQDSPVVSVTDWATSGAGSTALTSATANIPSDVIGNWVRISAGTNFTADYYRITGWNSATSITVAVSPTPSGAGSGGTGRIGGAWAFFHNASCSYGGSYSPPVESPCRSGNIIYIRGAGSDFPSSADYTSSIFFAFSGVGSSTSGDSTNGRLRIVGYNGRPRIDSNYMLIRQADYITFENIIVKGTGTNSLTSGFIFCPVDAYNCVFDQGGYDGIGLYAARRVDRCEFISSVAGSSPRPAVQLAGSGGTSPHVRNCVFNGWKGAAVWISNYGGSVCDNVISGCYYGIEDGTGNPTHHIDITNNSIYNCTSHGIYLSGAANAAVEARIMDNILCKNGGYGIKVNGTLAVNDRCMPDWLHSRNFFGSGTGVENTSGTVSGISSGSGDVTLTVLPWTNAASNDFSLNTTAGGGVLVRAAGGFTLPHSFGVSYRDGGAIQHQDSGGGGSTTIIMSNNIKTGGQL